MLPEGALTEDANKWPECLMVDDNLRQSLALQIVLEAVRELCMLQWKGRGGEGALHATVEGEGRRGGEGGGGSCMCVSGRPWLYLIHIEYGVVECPVQVFCLPVFREGRLISCFT